MDSGLREIDPSRKGHYSLCYILSVQESHEMTKLRIVTIGDSVGVILPKEILERLRVREGDTLYAIETPNGVELTPYDPEFAEQIRVAEDVMHEWQDVLRKLGE